MKAPAVYELREAGFAGRVKPVRVKLTGAAKRAQEYAALQDLRSQLVRKYEDLVLEIADLDHQLETRER